MYKSLHIQILHRKRMLNDWVNKDESLSTDKAQNKDNKLAGFRISSLKIYKFTTYMFEVLRLTSFLGLI